MRSTARPVVARAVVVLALVAVGVLVAVAPLEAEAARPIDRGAAPVSRSHDAVTAVASQDRSAQQAPEGEQAPEGQQAPGHGFTFNPFAGLSGVAAVFVGLALVVSLLASLVALATLRRMLFGWRSPDSQRDTAFAGVGGEQPLHSFSLIVPARHEERVLGDTLDRLAALDYPVFQVLVVVGHDDESTAAVAQAAAARHPDTIEVVVDHYALKNKPRALNTALPRCRGDLVGVFDAEDDVPPDLLRRLDAHFRATGADVVQSGVQKMNLRSSWYSLRSALESYFRSRSKMHFDAGRFLPLQGSSVFMRADALRAVGGWDPDCLAEGCDIGLRLQVEGAKVGAAHDNASIVREETPGTLRDLIKQRTRHDQGMLQVLRKGEWRDLPSRRERLSARFTLTAPFLQAAAVVLIILLLWLLPPEVPALVAAVIFVPLILAVVTLVVDAAGLSELGRTYGIKIRIRDWLRLVLGAIPYLLVLTVAAGRSVVREARGARGWEQTFHTGAHRVTARVGTPALAAVSGTTHTIPRGRRRSKVFRRWSR